jgi:DNA-binding transcriptional MerR regulator
MERRPPEPELVKMSVLAARSGVPAATIKHYVREGLLPEPARRTGRNMAYYDVALVPRILRIKELQRTHFLPLKVIKSVLDESELDSTDETAASAIARAVSGAVAQGETRGKRELLSAGMPAEQLEWLRSMGAIVPLEGFAEDTYGGDDIELLRVLAAARKAGITPEMLPITIVSEYAAALRELVRIEMRLFREGVVPRAGAGLSTLTEAATTLSERLVVLLRRKLLVPTLRDLARPPPRPVSPRTSPRRRSR